MEDNTNISRNDRSPSKRKRHNKPEEGLNPKKEKVIRDFFQTLDNRQSGAVSIPKLLDSIDESGISKNDPRLKECLAPFSNREKGWQTELNIEQFINLVQEPNAGLIRKVILKELAIPHFKEFRKEIEDIYEQTKDIKEGEPDSSLPHPGTEGSSAYAVSICTVDGQLLQLGDHELSFSLQSICKPVNYGIALEEIGEKALHQHVGVEPGNENFDIGMVLNEHDLPHNPLINSGAIMTASLIRPELEMEQRLKHVMDVWEDLCGEKPVTYKDESFEAERKSANKNFALAHLMKERGAFPENTDLGKTIDFYLKCCAIEVNIDALAHAAATLANFGLSPGTEKKVFQHDIVKNTLSLMLSSGMYDHSGEFAFRVGLPAKSGIAGGMMVVVPDLMGISVYSPPLDSHGNSVRGVKFCEKLVEKFNIHIFDAKRSSAHGKKNPRLPQDPA